MSKNYDPDSFLGRGLLVAAAVALAAWAASDRSKYALGTDLAGGTILEYQVLQDDPKNPKEFQMDELCSALKRRLDPDGLKSYRINGLRGSAVEIVMPIADQSSKEDLMRRISTVGQLRFRIVADSVRHKDQIELAEKQFPAKLVAVADPATGARQPVGEFVRFGVWRPVAEAAEHAQAEAMAGMPQGRDAYRYMDVELVEGYDPKEEAEGKYKVRAADGKKKILSAYDTDGANFAGDLTKVDADGLRYVFLVHDQWNVVGDDLSSAVKEPDHETGEPIVSFKFNFTGGEKFAQLTEAYSPDPVTRRQYRLAVVFENRVRSAANIREPIRAGAGRLSGFKSDEIDELVKLLNAGKLPIGLEKTPARDVTILATLGEDTIRSGAISVALSLVAVGLFMVWYYGQAGLVSVIALALNLLLTVGVMVALRQTWTLPGIAGLVLTVGMSIDANVLVFERIREELARGASVGTAIKYGYERAWHPILDSMVTSLLTALVLYFIGTDTVRGFAVTLVCGLVTGLFSGLFCTRLAFEWLHHKGWLTGFKFRAFLDNPNYNFLGFTGKAIALSLALIALGAAAFALRGGDNFDIDFTGGTKAAMRFEKPLEPAEVRERAGKAGLKDVAVERLASPGTEANREYIVRTTEKEEAGGNAIRAKLAAAFKDVLPLDKLGVGAVAPIDPKTEDAFLKPFAGGQTATLEFARANATTYVRSLVEDALREKIPNLAEAQALVAVRPLGDAEPLPGVAAGARGHKRFEVAAARQDLKALLDGVAAKQASSPKFEEVSSFGPQAASDMKTRAVLAIGLSWLLIVLWVGYRFSSWSFGLGGVVALIHEVFMSTGMLAFVSLLAVAIPALEYFMLGEMKLNLDSIAALLTLIGYSIHDTIVTFDRVRELRGRGVKVTAALVNRAVNETLSRTIITTMLTWLSVVILYIGGGPALRGFSFLLVVGLVSGAFSTIYIASPFMLWFMDWLDRRKAAQAGGTAVALPEAPSDRPAAEASGT